MRRVLKLALATAAIGIAATATPALATTAPQGISLCTSGASCVSGTTNVNLGTYNAPGSMLVTGNVGIGGPEVDFTSSQGLLETNTGAATVFTASGASLTNLTFTILSGFSAAEFNLENGTSSSFTITLTDSNPADTISQTFNKLQGSNIFDIVAPTGTTYTTATFTSTDGGFADFKQLRVVLGSPAAVPEAATWAMMLLGFGGIGMAMRRSKRRSSTLMQVA